MSWMEIDGFSRLDRRRKWREAHAVSRAFLRLNRGLEGRRPGVPFEVEDYLVRCRCIVHFMVADHKGIHGRSEIAQ